MEALTLVALTQQEASPESAPPESESPLSSFLFPMIVMGVLFYVIMLGPERKQRKKRDQMLAALKKGDRILTTSGMHGTVAAVADDVVTVQVADGVRLRFSRSAIQTVVEGEQPTEKEEPKTAKKA
jgi:preprotein translocase subunit YajC